MSGIVGRRACLLGLFVCFVDVLKASNKKESLRLSVGFCWRLRSFSTRKRLTMESFWRRNNRTATHHRSQVSKHDFSQLLDFVGVSGLLVPEDGSWSRCGEITPMSTTPQPSCMRTSVHSFCAVSYTHLTLPTRSTV